MGLDYLPSPLSRLRRQLSQGESQAGLSSAVHPIEGVLPPSISPAAAETSADRLFPSSLTGCLDFSCNPSTNL